MPTKSDFFADLRTKIRDHQSDVVTVFQPLDDTALTWRPNAKEWSVLICFDHLLQTYGYYQPKIERALLAPQKENGGGYRSSFWGSIYLFFALNPRWSFPTPNALMPSATPERAVFARYLAKEQRVLDLLQSLDGVDVTRTRIPIEKGITFNLGDCLRFLVYHDSLHIRQAHEVLAQYLAQGNG